MNFNLIFYFLVAVAVIAGALYLNRLTAENDFLKTTNATLLNANDDLTALNKQITNDFINGLNAISDLKNKNEKEVRYIEKVKTQIIRDNNATCRDSVNAVFNRLWEQDDFNGTDKNKASRYNTNTKSGKTIF